MKIITLRLLAALVFAAALVAGVFSFYQVNEEKSRLAADLERRAGILAESLQESVTPALEAGSVERLTRIAEKFGNRERLRGVAVYDGSANVLAVTSGLEAKIPKPSPQTVKAFTENMPAGDFVYIDNQRIYMYAQPIMREDKIIGVMALFHDASYIDIRLAGLWRYNLVRFLTLSVLIAVITLLIVRWSITRPIARFADWVRDLRAGKPGRPVSYMEGDVLAPLAAEVRHLARSLALAKARAEEEAKLRAEAESLWTANRLKEHMRAELGGKKLFLVSNREPYMHTKEGRGIKCIVPAGGLITALDPVMRVCDGVWVAHGGGDADRETVDRADKLRVPPEEPSYTLRRVWLDKDEEDGYYYGFSNEGLWPLCHITHTRPTFNMSDWVHYQKVNEKFADALLEEIEGEESPLVLVQDYHMALLPLLIKEKRPDAKVAIFWHIPWPNPEAFGICPWSQEILIGMLGADIIGFHTQFHCNNFLDTVDRFLESKIDWEKFSVTRAGHATKVMPFPISVSFERSAETEPRETIRERLGREMGVDFEFLGVGVDRVDYTKGIPERLRAIERFFEKYPEFVGRFTFVELGAPSRTHIKKYRDLMAEVEELVEKINWRFQAKKWKPVIFLKAHHSREAITPFYKAADVCMVTSLHDGMNLVAKEFVAARDDEGGVLILSKFAGASIELIDALIINPYDIEQMADSIYLSLGMEPGERLERMQRMRLTVREHNIYRWAAKLIEALARMRLHETANHK